jgi:sec-independent protein translocase protein TatA
MLAVGPLDIGPFEALVILAVVMIVFGVGRLPEVGGAVGRAIREFRKASREEEPPRQLPEDQASSEAPAPTAAGPFTPQSGPFCTNCGAKNSPGAKFCSECGSALPTRVN